MDRARAMYRADSNNKDNFNMDHCWTILANAAKWQDHLVSRRSRTTAVRQSQNQGQQSNNDLAGAEVGGNGESTRPGGRDKEKRAHASRKRSEVLGENIIKRQKITLKNDKTKMAMMRESLDLQIMTTKISDFEDEEEREYLRIRKRQVLRRVRDEERRRARTEEEDEDDEDDDE
jgi:hypothetical protein